jgi:hypothetical protein
LASSRSSGRSNGTDEVLARADHWAGDAPRANNMGRPPEQRHSRVAATRLSGGHSSPPRLSSTAPRHFCDKDRAGRQRRRPAKGGTRAQVFSTQRSLLTMGRARQSWSCSGPDATWCRIAHAQEAPSTKRARRLSAVENARCGAAAAAGHLAGRDAGTRLAATTHTRRKPTRARRKPRHAAKLSPHVSPPCCLWKAVVPCLATRLQPKLPCDAGASQPVVAGTRGVNAPFRRCASHPGSDEQFRAPVGRVG